MEGKCIEPSDPLLPQAVIRMRNALNGRLTLIRDTHVCGAETCGPVSEASLVRKGMLVGPPLTSNVFLCTRGTVHVCTESACEHYGFSNTRTCHLSGFQFGNLESQYDKGDFRTWRSKPETQTVIMVDPRLFLSQTGSLEALSAALVPPMPLPLLPKKQEQEEDEEQETTTTTAANAKKRTFSRKRVSDEELKTSISGMVKLLLYSPNRVARNREAIKSHLQDAHEARNTYERQQYKNRQQPYFTDTYRLVGKYTTKRLPFSEFVYSQNLHDYYVSIVTQVWHMVMRYYIPTAEKKYEDDGVTEILPRLDVGTVCLGVLYSMRQGVRRSGHTMLEKDDFLLMNLPTGPDLSFFDIRKRRVSVGEKIVSDTYDNAIAENAPLSSILIDVTLLPEKREDQCVTDGPVPMIITTSGERLFMPQTRKKK